MFGKIGQNSLTGTFIELLPQAQIMSKFNKPLQGMDLTECLLAYLHACLLNCLLACLIACLPACLPECLPTCLHASLLACFLAC